MQPVFDLTYDYTFRGVMINTGPVSAPECRANGVYLAWLSPVGWCYWLFAGNVDTDANIKSLGQVRRVGLTTDTQKERADVLTCRSGGLTRAQIDKVSTVLDSVAVFAIMPDSAGKIVAIQVGLEAATYAVWRDNSPRANIEFKVTFPARQSQRA